MLRGVPGTRKEAPLGSPPRVYEREFVRASWCYVPQRWYTNVCLRCLGDLGGRPHTQGVALRFSCRVATLVARSIS